MTEYPTLARAPIVEAVVDFRTIFAEGITPETLQQVQEAVADQFPNREALNVVEFEMGFTPAAEGIPPSFNAASGFGGYKLSSADRRRILQITPGGFVFSQLAPYQNGDIFRQRFWPIWEQFRSETKPARVQRIGLRCVNRINIPLPMSDFDDYFQTFLRLGPKVPQGIADLFLRFVLPDPNIPRQAATVILASEPRTPEAETLSLLFDIDAFRFIDLVPDDPVVGSVLDSLRQYRNQLFFESLTPLALELFQ